MKKIVSEIAFVLSLTICAFPAYADDPQQTSSKDAEGDYAIGLVQPLMAKPRNYDCPPEPFESATELRKQGISTEENWDFKIPCSEFLDLEKRALKGDVEAAEKLGTFYMYGGPSDIEHAAYWESIAEENGSISAMKNLAQYYSFSPKPEYKLRAEFWQKQWERHQPETEGTGK